MLRLILIVSLLGPLAGCESNTPPSQSTAATERACECPGLIWVQVTRDELVVAGNPIAKIERGALACPIEAEGRGIVPLYNLLAKVREIVSQQDWEPSLVFVKAGPTIQPDTLSALERTLHQVGGPYRVHLGPGASMGG